MPVSRRFAKGTYYFRGDLSSFAEHHVWKMSEAAYRQQQKKLKQIGYMEENGERWVKVLSVYEDSAPDVSAVPLLPRLEDGYLYLLAKDGSHEASV